MTPELEAKINAAMETSEGDRRIAAELLGITRIELHNFTHRNPVLRARWVASRAKHSAMPAEASQIHRPMPVITKPQSESAIAILSDADIAKAIEKEDSLVRNGLDNTGMKPKVRDLAMALQKLQNKHFTRCVEMLGGGITKQFLEIMVEVEELTRRLNDTVAPPTPEQELLWREDRSRLLDMMQKFYDRASSAALTQAKVHALKNQGNGRKSGKPGFSPLVAVQGQHVTINEAK